MDGKYADSSHPEFNMPGRTPGQYANAIRSNLHSLTRAGQFADEAIRMFLPDSHPLPRSLDRAVLLLDGRPGPEYYHAYLGAAALMHQMFRIYEAYPTEPGAQGYRNRVVRFADEMLANGTDRYGREHSPLFAGCLLRTSPSRLPDEIIYKTTAEDRRVRLANFPNIFLSDDGPHKATYCGGDPAEDEALYLLLYDMTRVLGKAQYKAAADKALAWWLSHAPSPVNGLFPWGEHAGWDFHNDGSYKGGPLADGGASPYSYSYHFDLHELRGGIGLYDRFVELQPRARPGELTVWEREAQALWSGHTRVAIAGAGHEGMMLWDRHASLVHADRAAAGDHHDLDNFLAFSSHAGRWIQAWAHALSRSRDKAGAAMAAGALDRFIDGLIEQNRHYGLAHFLNDGGWAGPTGVLLAERGNGDADIGSACLAAAAHAGMAGYPALRDKLLQTAAGAGFTGTAPAAPPYPGPAPASMPIPGDNADRISEQVSLVWTPGEGTMTQELYLGNSLAALRMADAEAPEFKASLSGTMATFKPAALARNATYFWCVDAIGSGGRTRGRIWSFTTGMLPSHGGGTPGGGDKVIFSVPGQGTLYHGDWGEVRSMAIFDFRGNPVRIEPVRGAHVSWRGIDEEGRPVAAGLYLIHLEGARKKYRRQFMMLR